MFRRGGLVLFVLVPALLAAAPPPKAPPPAPPPPPLAILPSIARVKIASLGVGTSVALTTEVSLPRGDWKGEALNFHVAYGAPAPRAIDAHLVPVGDGQLEPEDDEVGESLTVDHTPRRAGSAHLLLGREIMTGVLVKIPPNVMTKALARGNMASLRIRSVVEATSADAMGASSIVVRLGTTKSAVPLTLGRIVTAGAPITKIDARLCGPDADPHALAVGGLPKQPPSAEAPPIAPVLAVRHATDDLCLRFWVTQLGR